MVTLSLARPVARSPVPCPRSPVLDRYPIRRARLARSRAVEALEFARQAMQQHRALAARGYLDEAVHWQAMAQAIERKELSV